MPDITQLPDTNAMCAFDAKVWIDIAYHYKPVGLSIKQLRAKVDGFWQMYFLTKETRWLNIIAVCQREILKRSHKQRTTNIELQWHT